jgi:fluoride exporter
VEPAVVVTGAGTSLARPRQRVGQVMAVAAGGAIGAPLRYELARWFPVAAGAFPATTLCVNVSGAFLLGVLVARLDRRYRWSGSVRAFLGVGFLGAYTTFSTFTIELVLLGKDGHAAIALVYAIASLVLGPGAVVLGVGCASRLPRRNARVRTR